MKKELKETLLAVTMGFMTLAAIAGPHGGRGGNGGGSHGGRAPSMNHGGGHRPAPRYHHPRRDWGPRPRYYWDWYDYYTPVVIGTTVLGTTVAAQPVVVQAAQPTMITTQPVATPQSVWVEGRYVDQVQANGSVVRTWQPGHYEQVQPQNVR